MAPKRNPVEAKGPKTPASKGKRPREPPQIAYETPRQAPRATDAAPRPIQLCCRRQRPPTPAPGEDLVFMVLDIVEEAQGRFNVWGTTAAGASVLLRLTSFQPYFYVAAPKKPVHADKGAVQEAGSEEAEVEWDEGMLRRLQSALNHQLPSDSRLARIEAVHRTPILFYRPDKPQGDTFLKLHLLIGASVKRASTALQKALVSGSIRHEGLVWRDTTLYEAEVNSLQRVLVDVPVSGGAWLYVPPAAPTGGIAGTAGSAAEAVGRGPPGTAAAGIRTDQQHWLGDDLVAEGSATSAARVATAGGWRHVPEAERISSCEVEAVAPWQAVCCLTPDATQLADPRWSPLPSCLSSCGASGSTDPSSSQGRIQIGAPAGGSQQHQHRHHHNQQVPAEVQRAAEAAKRGDIAGLRMMVLDVLAATADGADRVAVASQGDPVVAITCTFLPFAARGHGGHATEGEQQQRQQQQQQQQQQAQHEQQQAGAAVGLQEEEDSDGGLDGDGEEPEVVASLAAVAGGPTGSGARRTATAATSGAAAAEAAGAAAAAAVPAAEQETLVFMLHPSAAAQRQECVERSASAKGEARVLLFGSEAELLLSWLAVVREADPDVIALFEVNDTLAVLQQRFAALRLEGGGLQLSRLLPRAAKPLSIKKITMYSAQWVRSQSRMSSTSNQETWRADIDGRVVVDVLRQVLTAQNLASFSLVDCVQSLLGQTIEVLRPSTLAALAGLAGSPPQQLHHQRLYPAAAAQADALRVARYALRRGEAVGMLLHRLATLPEMIEMARATGLTLGQVSYNAQIIRSWSLVLRTALRKGLVVGGRENPLALSESPFLLHPLEQGTVGLYHQPVAILDFASLYPSIYRAHNLCYSTLVHKQDQGRLAPGDLTITPTGAAFVKPSVRQGILPGILAALIAARGATREQLKAAADPAARAVLDSRQKALKVTANALYGFTGAGASPLQCIQLADSCLAYGAQSCRRAKQVLEEAAAAGKLAPHGDGARIIYGHTDSLFVLLPKAKDAKQAIAAGRLASKVVTAAFPPPMELKFERVCLPFLLLHVNRYAGRAFEREEDVERGGELICKGVKSMWRQAAPILRTTLHGALVRILMQYDVRGALDFVSGEVRRLLSGQVELHELIMTGGLWRVTGDQVESAAAAEGGASAEDVKGPHASLAVRLSQRDPGRTFVLGERLPYVLLAGERLQEDAAEDPLTAAKAGQEGDYSLYWKRKLLKPLEEVFRACHPPGQQQQALMNELLGGEHTRVRVDALSPPPPALGPASPPPGGPRSRGLFGAPRQSQMAHFFRPIPKCLGCKSSMPGFKGATDDAPGLCETCASTEDKWEETYTGLLDEQGGTEARQSAAYAACCNCHSGGALQPVLCENGECPVTYTRLSCSSRAQQLDKQLRRMDICW